jgi:hypothetical protein
MFVEMCHFLCLWFHLIRLWFPWTHRRASYFRMVQNDPTTSLSSLLADVWVPHNLLPVYLPQPAVHPVEYNFLRMGSPEMWTTSPRSSPPPPWSPAHRALPAVPPQSSVVATISPVLRRRGCRMDLPGPTTSVGTRTDYSVGPWDYLTCAARYLMAWSTRTRRRSTRLGSCTCPALCRGLLDVLD